MATTNDPYLPTDAMSFYLAEIPSISFFTGTHEEYHTPRDTFDKLNYDGLVKTIKVVKSFIDQLGKADLKYQKVEGSSSQKLEGRSFRVFLGTIPDYSQESVKGVKISGASKNSPAEKAGLVAGDIIVSFDGVQIENIYDYVFVLQSVKPNVKTSIEVLRSSEKKKLEITPLLKD